MQYMIFETLRVMEFLTVFFWVMTSPAKLLSVATQKTKIQMSSIRCFHSIFINVSEHNDLIFHVHSKSLPDRQYESLSSSGSFIHSFIHSVFCLTTGSEPPPQVSATKIIFGLLKKV